MLQERLVALFGILIKGQIQLKTESLQNGLSA